MWGVFGGFVGGTPHARRPRHQRVSAVLWGVRGVIFIPLYEVTILRWEKIGLGAPTPPTPPPLPG